jgi:hypothetical protein
VLQYLNLKTGTIRKAGLKGIANEPVFYKLHDLTPEEIQLIKGAVIDPCPDPLRQVQLRYLDLFTFAPRLKARLATSSNDPDFKAALEDVIVNAAEHSHQWVEDRLKRFINCMLAENCSFYSNAKQAADFLYAICVQFTRTKRARQEAIATLGTKYKGCDAERLWKPTSQILAMSVGRSLYADRHQYKLVLIDNDTRTPFVTGDQPIINLHAKLTGEPPDKLEFYYPLSPQKAMLLLEQGTPPPSQPLSELAVNSYNILMAKNAFEQMFSNSAEYLKTLRAIRSLD